MLVIKIINSYRIHYFRAQRKLATHCYFLITLKMPGKNEQTKSLSFDLPKESSSEGLEWLETQCLKIFSAVILSKWGKCQLGHWDNKLSIIMWLFCVFLPFHLPVSSTCCSWNTALNRTFMVQTANTCTAECAGGLAMDCKAVKWGHSCLVQWSISGCHQPHPKSNQKSDWNAFDCLFMVSSSKGDTV